MTVGDFRLCRDIINYMTFYSELRGLDGAARSATGVNGLYFRDDKVLKFTSDQNFRVCQHFGVVFGCPVVCLKHWVEHAEFHNFSRRSRLLRSAAALQPRSGCPGAKRPLRANSAKRYSRSNS